MEKSPSLVYGARLELVYGLIAHRGFESLLLRHVGAKFALLRLVFLSATENKSSARFLAPPLTQKVTLGSPIRL